MKRLLIAFLAVFIASSAFTQFCPFLGPDQYLPCGVGSTTLTADLSQCGPGGANPNQTTNYNVTNIPYVAQTNTGTSLFMTDDSQQGPFQIGFNFCFFGTTYTQFWVGSNGWISFSGGQPTTFTSQPIPTANILVPKNCILGPWQDWHPGLGGQIRYQVQGVAPCRKLVVSWIGVPMYSCTNLQGTFHIVIYESTNVIENHIANKPACLQWQNGTATQGIHNLAGTVGIASPGRNSTAWTTTNNAYRWTPSGPVVTPVLTWYQVGNPNPIGTGPTITVTPPPAGANYTCQFVYPVCNAGWVTCNAGIGNGPDTVFVQPGPPQLPPPIVILNDPHCNNGCDGSITVVPNGGTGVTTISWNGQGNSMNITNLCPGAYTYNLIDAAGCTYNGIVTLNNPPPLPAPLINSFNPTCAGYCDGAATANPVGGVAPYTFLWSNSQTTQTISNLCSGTYSVTVYDTWNCPAIGNTTLVNPPAVQPSPIVASDTVCFGSSNILYTVNPTPGYTYNWQTVGNLTSPQGGSSATVDWSNESSGFIPGAVQVITYNQQGCSSVPSAFDLTIFLLNPLIDPMGPYCSNEECVGLSAIPIGGTFTINGNTVTQFCPNTNSTFDDIIYTYTQSGCIFDDTLNVTVYPQPNLLSITPENHFIELCEGDTASVVYTVTSTLPGAYTWEYDNSTLTSGNMITTNWDTFGIFLISSYVTTAEGCVSPEISTTLTIQECPNTLIYIPNSFTPDGDEHNNRWLPTFTSGFDPYSFNLTIYNRYGQIIFESNDSTEGWDGTYNNVMCQDGIYSYIISYGNLKDDGYNVIRGHITLIR